MKPIMNLKNKFIPGRTVTNPYTAEIKTVIMDNVRPISIEFLKNNPDYLEKFEKDWEELNNTDSERFSNWLETASPTALENYRVFSEYKNRKPTLLDKLGKFIDGLADFFDSPIGSFISKFLGAALVAVFVTGGLALMLLLLLGLGFIAFKLLAINPMLSISYTIFMFIFITTLLSCFDL
jgi:hypothetical protein